MPYRPCPDLPPPSDADIDTGEIVEMAAVVERGERHLRILAELSEIAMTLARSLGEAAQVRIATAKAGDSVLPPGEDPVAAFSRMSQTIRRTINLEARLATHVNTGRAGLAAARSARRDALDEAHKAAVDGAIDQALIDAFLDAYPEPDNSELEEVLYATESFRSEYDEFRDYLDRPVGETVARVCALLNLDPTSCVDDGGAWVVRRRHEEYDAPRDPRTGSAQWSDEVYVPDLRLPSAASAPAATGPPP